MSPGEVNLMVVALAMLLTGYLAGAFHVGLLARRKRKRETPPQPMHERMALAAEENAEYWMQAGHMEAARRNYEEAKRIRREAHQALMDGETWNL